MLSSVWGSEILECMSFLRLFFFWCCGKKGCLESLLTPRLIRATLPGKLTARPMKIPIFPGKYHQNGGCSMGYVSLQEGTPWKFNIDTKHGHLYSLESPAFQETIILGILQPLVFGGVFTLRRPSSVLVTK